MSFHNYLTLGAPSNSTLDAAASIAGLAIVIWCVAALLQVRSRVLREETRVAPFPSANPDPKDTPLLDELKKLMADDEIYREHGLTITSLAQRMNEKDYRLRRAINGTLGFRNFNQFLNHYRVDAATRQLVDPTTRRLPVLTIALDVGYSSLAPFNKAFRDKHGITPTEYRKQFDNG